MQNTRKLLEVMGMSVTLTEVIESWIYAYVQIYPIAYTKYVQFFRSIISQ